jgi:hypothetical protein
MSDTGKPKQEMTFFDEVAGDLTDVSAEDKAALEAFQKQGMKEEMKGLPITAPKVEILHAGAVAFKFVEAPEDDQIKKSFLGVIIHVDPQRAFWKKDPEEGGTGQMPDCYSRDLVKPDAEATDQQSADCASCPHNAFGSAEKGRGKACKEVRRVFFLPEGKLDAHVMNVPPTSLKALKTYFTFLAENKIQRPQMAITKFGVKQAENKAGTEYTELVLTFHKKVDERLLLLVLQMKKGIEEMTRHAAPIQRDDYVKPGDTQAS